MKTIAVVMFILLCALPASADDGDPSAMTPAPKPATVAIDELSALRISDPDLRAQVLAGQLAATPLGQEIARLRAEAQRQAAAAAQQRGINFTEYNLDLAARVFRLRK